MSKKLLITIYCMPVLILAVLWLVLSSFGPAEAGPGGILAVFVMVYVLCASVLFTALHFGLRSMNHLTERRARMRGVLPAPMSAKRSYYMASILAFGPVLLLALNSVRQLRAQDVVLVGLFLVLAIFYIAKRD